MLADISDSAAEVCAPPYFRCPISLDLMRDPVTLCTGISYDRSSIERWIEDGHITCPYTGQILWNSDLTPNLALRNLIEAWKIANGVVMAKDVDLTDEHLKISDVEKLLLDLLKKPRRIDIVQRLRSKAKHSKHNSECIADAGAITALTLVLSSQLATIRSSYAFETETRKSEVCQFCDEIIRLLVLLPLSGRTKRIAETSNITELLCWLLQEGITNSKLEALHMLVILIRENIASLSMDLFDEVSNLIVGLLHNKPEERIYSVCLEALRSLCSIKQGKARLVEAGACSVLINLLRNADEKDCEEIVASVELLCRCAEGREALCKNPGAIPCLVQSLTGLSTVAAMYAVDILWLICKIGADESSRRMAVKSGICENVLWILTTDEVTPKSKYRLIDILRMLKSMWEEHCAEEQFENEMS